MYYYLTRMVEISLLSRLPHVDLFFFSMILFINFIQEYKSVRVLQHRLRDIGRARSAIEVSPIHIAR